MKTFKLLSASFLVAFGISAFVSSPGASAAVGSLFAAQWAPWVQIVQPQSPAPESPSGSLGSSLNWAGYEANGGGYTAISGTWTVPSVPVANGSQADATWVGIGGVTSRDLIQGGTQAIVNGTSGVQYLAFFETLPGASQSIPVTVHAGDSVTASLNETNPSSGTWSFSFHNNTTGASYQTPVQYNSSNSTAEWIEEMPTSGNSFVPLDSFGSVTFTNATVTKSGVAMGMAAAGATPITMVGNNGGTLATTSAIASATNGFTVTRSVASGSSVVASSGYGNSRYGYSGRGAWRHNRTPLPPAPVVTSDENGTITISFFGWQL